MKCIHCNKDLPESEFYAIKKKEHICKKCYNKREKEYRIKNILDEENLKAFDRYYGGIKINITNYPQSFEIIKTSGEYFFTKDKEKFIKKLLDILN